MADVMTTEAVNVVGPVPDRWTRRHLLGLEELSAEEITIILDKATVFKRLVAGGQTKIPLLTGRTCVTLFFENSTRTRTSFSLAARRLGPIRWTSRRPPAASPRGRRSSTRPRISRPWGSTW